MISGLTYKRKNKMLLAGFLVMLLAGYFFSFSKTVNAYRESKALEEQSELAANAPVKAAELERQLKEMSDLPDVKNDTGAHVQQTLLGIITGYCQESNSVLREFPQTVYHEENDFRVETNVFTVEANFSQLLKLVYLLEQESKPGKISSVRYFARKDPKTKQLALNATIYLQNIKKQGHEK